MAFQGPLTLEIGRGLTACCGTYLTTVVDAKTNQKVNYAIVDGGIHHLTYYGGAMAMKQPPVRFLEETDGNVEAVRGGVACSGDRRRRGRAPNLGRSAGRSAPPTTSS